MPRLRRRDAVDTSRIFLNDTSAALHVIAKRSPFAFQKGSFCIVKGLLLQSKTTPFASQKDSFWKSGIFMLLHPTFRVMISIVKFEIE